MYEIDIIGIITFH
jgi:hypothetical protein